MKLIQILKEFEGKNEALDKQIRSRLQYILFHMENHMFQDAAKEAEILSQLLKQRGKM